MAITLESEPDFCERGLRIAQNGIDIIGRWFLWNSRDNLILYGPNPLAPSCGETSVYWLSPEYKILQKIPVSSISESTPSPYTIFRSQEDPGLSPTSPVTHPLSHISAGVSVSLKTAVTETINRANCNPGELKCECEGYAPYAPYTYTCFQMGPGTFFSTDFSRQGECKERCASVGIYPSPDPIVETMLGVAEQTGIPISPSQAAGVVAGANITTVDSPDYTKEAIIETTASPIVISSPGIGATPCNGCFVPISPIYSALPSDDSNPVSSLTDTISYAEAPSKGAVVYALDATSPAYGTMIPYQVEDNEDYQAEGLPMFSTVPMSEVSGGTRSALAELLSNPVAMVGISAGIVGILVGITTLSEKWKAPR